MLAVSEHRLLSQGRLGKPAARSETLSAREKTNLQQQNAPISPLTGGCNHVTSRYFKDRGSGCGAAGAGHLAVPEVTD